MRYEAKFSLNNAPGLFPHKRDGILTFHPEIGQDQSRDQSRPVETQPTVRQNLLAVGHQSSPELRQRVQLVQVWQFRNRSQLLARSVQPAPLLRGTRPIL